MAKVSEELSRDLNHLPMESGHKAAKELSEASSKIPEIGKHKTAIALSMDAHSGLFHPREDASTPNDDGDEDDMEC